MLTTSTLHTNLKCSLDETQIADRLKYNPQVIELQLFEQDLDNPERIVGVIRRLEQEGIDVFLHHPMTVGGKYLDMLSEDDDIADYYQFSCRVLADICEQERIQCVVHPHYAETRSGSIDEMGSDVLLGQCEEMAVRIESIQTQLTDRFLWENAPRGIFSAQNPRWISDIVAPSNVPLCYDISHAYMGLDGSNEALLENLQLALPYVHYYHVVDSVGGLYHDALPLGQGTIDWKALKPFITARDFIFEIGLLNHEDATAMVESAEYFAKL